LRDPAKKLLGMDSEAAAIGLLTAWLGSMLAVLCVFACIFSPPGDQRTVETLEAVMCTSWRSTRTVRGLAGSDSVTAVTHLAKIPLPPLFFRRCCGRNTMLRE
jgi:hypothetical protein